MRNKERVLVIGAHPDDESFGCLGTLLKHQKNGDKIAFQWFTNGRDSKQVEGGFKAAAFLKATCWRGIFEDQNLDAVPLTALIKDIEDIIYIFQPTIVYTNFIGDLNKDHRLVSEATMVTCRPYKPNAPKEVWMYGIPGTTELGFRPMKVDKKVLIDSKKKEELIKLWYPNELINGRTKISKYENYERWPRC